MCGVIHQCISGPWGPRRRSSGPGDYCSPPADRHRRPATGRHVHDKDPPLAAFGARVPVKLDVASWLRANPGPRAIFRCDGAGDDEAVPASIIDTLELLV